MWGKWGLCFRSRSTQGQSAAEADTGTGATSGAAGGEGSRDVRAAAATRRDFALYPRPSVKGHWQCLETFLVVTIRAWILLQSSGKRPGMLLKHPAVYRMGPQTENYLAQMSWTGSPAML